MSIPAEPSLFQYEVQVFNSEPKHEVTKVVPLCNQKIVSTVSGRDDALITGIIPKLLPVLLTEPVLCKTAVD